MWLDQRAASRAQLRAISSSGKGGQGRACPHSKRDGGPDRVIGGAHSCAVRLALNQTGYGERLDVLMHPLVVATDRSGERGDARFYGTEIGPVLQCSQVLVASCACANNRGTEKPASRGARRAGRILGSASGAVQALKRPTDSIGRLSLGCK